MKPWAIAILFVILTLSIPSQAQTVTGTALWQTILTDTSGVALVKNSDGSYNVAAGASFQAHVQVTPFDQFKHATLAFKWGSATSMGTGAVESVDNFDCSSWTYDTSFSGATIQMGGFRQIGDNLGTATGDRGYGDWVTLSGTANHAAKSLSQVAVFTLINKMAVGTSGAVGVWSAGQDIGTYATGWTTLSYPQSGSPLSFPTANESLVVWSGAPPPAMGLEAVPEPSSLMAMGCAGVGVLGNLLHRRRKKIAAKS